MDLTRYEDLLYTHANARRCMRVVFLHLVHRGGGGGGGGERRAVDHSSLWVFLFVMIYVESQITATTSF